MLKRGKCLINDRFAGDVSFINLLNLKSTTKKTDANYPNN
jgi:hypothetical protein